MSIIGSRRSWNIYKRNPKQRRQTNWSHMSILNICWQRYQNIWMIKIAIFWKNFCLSQKHFQKIYENQRKRMKNSMAAEAAWYFSRYSVFTVYRKTAWCHLKKGHRHNRIFLALNVTKKLDHNKGWFSGNHRGRSPADGASILKKPPVDSLVDVSVDRKKSDISGTSPLCQPCQPRNQRKSKIE